MRLGPLRHRVRIEYQAQEQDSSTGAVTVVWTEYARGMAAIEPLNARELIAASSTREELTAKIRMRHIAGVTGAMRVVEVATGRVFAISGPPVTDAKSGQHWMVLMVSEKLKPEGA